jgi:hypothetical protein
MNPFSVTDANRRASALFRALTGVASLFTGLKTKKAGTEHHAIFRQPGCLGKTL